MKALSVWQPWASLIVLGHKDVENRSWRSDHRGPLLIHAGKKFDEGSWWTAKGICAELGLTIPRDKLSSEIGPFGALVGYVEVIDYARSDRCLSPWANREPGGWCWVLASARPFARPISYRGQQGLFEVPDAVLEAPNG